MMNKMKRMMVGASLLLISLNGFAVGITYPPETPQRIREFARLASEDVCSNPDRKLQIENRKYPQKGSSKVEKRWVVSMMDANLSKSCGELMVLHYSEDMDLVVYVVNPSSAKPKSVDDFSAYDIRGIAVNR